MKNAYLTILAIFVLLFAAAQKPKLKLVQIASGFSSPVDIKNCGDGRIFIVQQAGKIRIMDKSGNIRATPFLDITSRVLSAGNEQGLLSLAFSPNYKQDSSFYINYITGSGNGSTVISRFKVSADSNVADAGSEKVLLTFTQPFTNHNGATLMFGPDNYLYDTQGDGGSGGDPYFNGQNRDVYLAKILRLDVSNPDTTYQIPPTNPFADSSNLKPEIWAYGVRNPWRCSFDRITGDMWIGDVGQDLYEEIDFQAAGAAGGRDYGWNCREGFHAYSSSCGVTSGFTDPVFEYAHSTPNGCSIIGGYVYRGSQFGNLFGQYIFTDFCSGRFVDIRHPNAGTFIIDTLQSFLTNQYSSFGEDNNGEMYVAGRVNGNIYHLTDTSTCNPVAFISFNDTAAACNGVTLSALYGDTLSYQWYDFNGPVNGATSLQYTTTASGWYKVQVTKRSGCQSISDSVYANVLQSDALLPCNCNSEVCVDQAPFSLNNYFNPGGGVYAGTGVSADSVFSPAVAGAGTDVLLYTYVNASGCVSTASLSLQVGTQTQLVNAVPTTVYCNTNGPVALDGFITPTGGTYSGIAVSGNSFDPGIGLAHDTVFYSYTNSSGCISNDTFQLAVALCTGVKEPVQETWFSIFPNPGHGVFEMEIHVTAMQQSQITVMDELGRICLQREQLLEPANPIIPIDLSELSKGVYMVQLKGVNGTATKKLVLQ